MGKMDAEKEYQEALHAAKLAELELTRKKAKLDAERARNASHSALEDAVDAQSKHFSLSHGHFDGLLKPGGDLSHKWEEYEQHHAKSLRNHEELRNAVQTILGSEDDYQRALKAAELAYQSEKDKAVAQRKRKRTQQQAVPGIIEISDDDEKAERVPASMSVVASNIGDEVPRGTAMSIDVVDDDASDNDEDTLTDELLSTAGQVLPGQAEMEAVFAKHLDALSEEKEYATIQALCAEIFPRDIPLEVRSQVVPALVTTFRAYAYSHGFQEDWLRRQDNIFDAWKVLSDNFEERYDLGALKKIEEDVEYYDRDMESLHGAYPLTNLEQLLKWREEDDKDAIVLHCAKEASSVVIESFFNLVFQYEKSVNIMVEEAYEKLFAANPSAAAADDVQKFLRICFRAWGVEHDKFAPDQLITQKQKLKEKNEIYEAWTEISRLYELKKVPLPVLQAPKPASKRPRKGIDILKDVFGSFYAYLQSQHSWSNSHKVEQLMKQTGYTTNNIDDTTQKLMVLCFETDNYEALWDLFLKVMGFLRLLAPSKLTATLVFGSPSKEWPRAPLNPKNYDYTYVHESISGPRKTKQSRSVPALGAQGGSVVQDYRTESDASEAED